MRNLVTLLAALLLSCTPTAHGLPTRALLARASATSFTSAKDGGVANSVANAVAKGDVKAVADVIATANQGGKADATAQALADAARKDPSKRNAIAQAVAEATDLSVEDANRALANGNVANLAQAIALSAGGKTTATAISLSQAIEESQSAIANGIVDAYSYVAGGGEAFAAAEANVGAIGTAIAKAYASAEVELSVEGDGYAAGVSESNAEALAEAFAEVLVEGFSKASNDFGVVTASFKVHEIANVIATATARAYVEGSQTGEGKTSGFQTSVGEAVAQVLVQVVAEALTTAFGKGGIDSYVYVDPTVTTTSGDKATTETESGSTTSVGGTVKTDGSATAVTNIVCSGPVRICCNFIKVKSTTCSTLCSGVGPCSFTRNYEENGVTKEWKNDKTGEVCSC